MNADVLALLDTFGPLLNAREMASLWKISVQQFYANAKTHAYTAFEVHPAVGPRKYSKVLVARYLNGEPIDQPARVFGRKRAS